ncbi:MAG: nucleoside deaminase [Actinomycetota bacterium]
MNEAEAMELALAEAEAAPEHDDVPVGAVLLSPQGELLAAGHNVRERDQDPLGHAELVVIRQACRKLETWRLDGCTLVVTLEPCAMCAGALVQSRVRRLVYGALDPKAGAVSSLYDLVRDQRVNHVLEVEGGLEEAASAALLSHFFTTRRGNE